MTPCTRCMSARGGRTPPDRLHSHPTRDTSCTSQQARCCCGTCCLSGTCRCHTTGSVSRSPSRSCSSHRMLGVRFWLSRQKQLPVLFVKKPPAHRRHSTSPRCAHAVSLVHLPSSRMSSLAHSAHTPLSNLKQRLDGTQSVALNCVVFARHRRHPIPLVCSHSSLALQLPPSRTSISLLEQTRHSSTLHTRHPSPKRELHNLHVPFSKRNPSAHATAPLFAVAMVFSCVKHAPSSFCAFLHARHCPSSKHTAQPSSPQDTQDELSTKKPSLHLSRWLFAERRAFCSCVSLHKSPEMVSVSLQRRGVVVFAHRLTPSPHKTHALSSSKNVSEHSKHSPCSFTAQFSISVLFETRHASPTAVSVLQTRQTELSSVMWSA